MATERTDGPTPNGGAYSQAVFMDDAGTPVEKDQATQVIVTEYSAHGAWVAETIARLERAS